jgi:hypothetical protein
MGQGIIRSVFFLSVPALLGTHRFRLRDFPRSEKCGVVSVRTDDRERHDALSMIDPSTSVILRRLLCSLGDAIRDTVVSARATARADELAEIAAVTAADTIYRVDKISEATIFAWFAQHWPRTMPVEVVMEGLEEHGPLTFPEATPVAQTQWKCILDPIDGTRNIMYDKRPAWALGAIAPQLGPATHLGDIVVAAMTELPTSKQARADQISGVRGCGASGIVAEGFDLASRTRCAIALRPSRATDLRHSFATLSRFFPEGKALTAQIEEELWDRLHGLGRSASPLVFEDQYATTGGQIYELLAGHDRMVGDIRPLVLPKLGFNIALCCHPYDICTSMLLQEAGGVVETPEGRALTVLLDTTSPVAWLGFANAELAALVRPHLHAILRHHDLL